MSLRSSAKGLLVAALAVVAAAVSATPAPASQLIDRNASAISLQVNDRGEALLTYTAHGRLRHVLAWGAVNATPSRAGVRQVKFRLDYSGGYARYFHEDPLAHWLAAADIGTIPLSWQAPFTTPFSGGCGRYDGPPVAWAVAECKAPDGSYWAVQVWQRELPDYGFTPKPNQFAEELRLSHWTGALPVLTVATDWSWHRWDHLYGSLTYDGSPVYGFLVTSGTPLDGFGRNVYIDTFGSTYGPGWRREGSALTHQRTGVFCYSVNPHGKEPAGTGSEYRVTVIGPGVTPDLMWTGPSPGPYSAAADAVANARIAALHDRLCRPN